MSNSVESIRIYGVQVYGKGGANPAWHYTYPNVLTPVHDPGAITTALLNAIITNFEGEESEGVFSGFGTLNYLAFDHNTSDSKLKEIIIEFDKNTTGSTIALIRDKIGSENQRITGNIIHNFLEMYEIIKEKYSTIQNINDTLEWNILIGDAALGLSNVAQNLKEKEKLYSDKKPILKFTFPHNLEDYDRKNIVISLGKELLSLIQIEGKNLKEILGSNFLPNKNKIMNVNTKLISLINNPDNFRAIEDFKNDYELISRVLNELTIQNEKNPKFIKFVKQVENLKNNLLDAINRVEFRYFKEEDELTTFIRKYESNFKNLCYTLIWSSRDLFRLKGESFSRRVFASFSHKGKEYWLSIYQHIKEENNNNLSIGNVGGLLLKPISEDISNGNPGWILTEALKNTTLFCHKYTFTQSDVTAKLSTTEKSLAAETKSYIDFSTASKAYLAKKYTRTHK